MFQSSIYDYINVLDTAADASALRQKVIAQNIANDDTPGYIRQDVSFERELDRALGYSPYDSMDARVAALRERDVRYRIYEDRKGFTYRMDDNNVDMDTENAYLAENQIKYNALMESMKVEFSNLRIVMK